ncbi:hypothetical protein E2562_025049 [Oryza meyeriana var. granulata]|uniref:Bifunctional inhibitor/plant lipid transfer protein/seed storage helical domain-containing protein n=1 Tax=Oryza meyeriana var. granulata TaxID=110450 RepID=A0A6G1D7L1_9ORYZ|nr:hypothetical protein E2562_025049 [Oryza meyeriana var. granulata]
MAPHMRVIVLLLAFAVAGATRQPSEARVQGLKPTAASQESSEPGIAGEQEVQEAATTSTPAGSLFPVLPPLPPLLPLPALPPLPPLPALPPLPPLPPLPSPGTTWPPSPPRPPTECLTSFIELLPCVDYLTNATAPAVPPSTCCAGFRSLVSSALICLCHGINGDMSRLLSRPIDPVRMVLLPAMCSTMLPPQSLFMCYSK